MPSPKERYQALVAAAGATLDESGSLHSVTRIEIADRVGVSRATVTNYLGDNASILMEAADYVLQHGMPRGMAAVVLQAPEFNIAYAKLSAEQRQLIAEYFLNSEGT